MADRKVFTAAMFTAVLLLAGAFVLPRSFFLFELAKSSIYFAVAALVYYAEDRYGYMLGDGRSSAVVCSRLDGRHTRPRLPCSGQLPGGQKHCST